MSATIWSAELPVEQQTAAFVEAIKQALLEPAVNATGILVHPDISSLRGL